MLFFCKLGNFNTAHGLLLPMTVQAKEINHAAPLAAMYCPAPGQSSIGATSPLPIALMRSQMTCAYLVVPSHSELGNAWRVIHAWGANRPIAIPFAVHALAIVAAPPAFSIAVLMSMAQH